MTDRPIIFSAPMVRALLDGRKTQTRRIYKVPSGSYVEQGGVWAMTDGCAYGDAALPYATGDRLWVRETWRPHYLGDGVWNLDVSYPADGERRTICDGEFGDKGWNWPKAADCGNVTPLHMPRWASRLTLTVTDVRVQRLQDVSEADAVAEGCDAVLALTIKRPNGAHPGNPRECYCDLWNSLHGHGAWDANPWVVALTFTVQRGNIDKMPGAK